MKTRYCLKCNGRTPWNKAENRKDCPYICEGCNSIVKEKDLKKWKEEKNHNENSICEDKITEMIKGVRK